ncbi:hypothetical protein BK133_13790, partial [Paenibacillus sp. FSL H8-0548]
AERNVGELLGGLVWDSRKFTASTTINFPRTQAILHICSNFALFSLSELAILHICKRIYSQNMRFCTDVSVTTNVFLETSRLWCENK